MCVGGGGAFNLSMRLSRNAASRGQSSLLSYIRTAFSVVCLLMSSTWHWLSNEAENEEDQDQLTHAPQMFIAIYSEDSI